MKLGEVFGCSGTAIHKALKQLNITLRNIMTYFEQDPEKVKEYQKNNRI